MSRKRSKILVRKFLKPMIIGARIYLLNFHTEPLNFAVTTISLAWAWVTCGTRAKCSQFIDELWTVRRHYIFLFLKNSSACPVHWTPSWFLRHYVAKKLHMSLFCFRSEESHSRRTQKRRKRKRKAKRKQSSRNHSLTRQMRCQNGGG